ncbi:hypothetical protein OFB79_24815, partial [Escherichia coli]|nr:hypothetical protein [Escherichia coli]
ENIFLQPTRTNHKTKPNPQITNPIKPIKMAYNPNKPGAPLYSQAVSQDAGEPVTAEQIEKAPTTLASLEKEQKSSTEKKDESKTEVSSSTSNEDAQEVWSPGLF